MRNQVKFILTFFCLNYLHECENKALLENNGYTDLVVGISPDIPESQAQEVINNIKLLMTEASKELFIASRNRAYYKQVKILLPQTWKNTPFDQPLSGEFYETAEVRIDRPNPVYGDAPYTVRGAGCGVPGSYIHITPSYLKNSTGGNVGKTTVHEWAKLRWGVYEEHGYPGDEQFPLIFYKTIFTADGERQKKTYNFCTNDMIYGYEQDIKTGGQCSNGDNGMPDENCMFFVSQQTSATASYMALPYISSVQNFCDNTEELMHDSDLPNKQNLFCDGQSTWEVILTSPDFANNNNPADDSISNTVPEFITIGSQLSSVEYVLVMDTSMSMITDPRPPNQPANRLANMIDAAKRWVKYDIQDGVKLGVATFSDYDYVRIMQAMVEINDANRDVIIDSLGEITATGQTCIGCGLKLAANNGDLLAGKSGGNILLITDGKQNCAGGADCVEVSEMTDLFVERNIRVVTIAMGPDADPEIEDLAERTGGKSYYVEDYGTSGNINDAFGGSTTYQPGDTIGNTDIEVYQRDWTIDEKTIKDVFDVDSSIGRELVFQVDVSQEKSTDECQKNITIQFVIPGESSAREETFKCSKNNFGVFKMDLTTYSNPNPATEGRWLYRINKDDNEKVSISVKITAKAKDADTDPIMTKCWIETGTQQINSEADLKLSVVAEVRQGNKPVIGAKVQAVVERPAASNGDPYPPIEVELADNGAGADFIKNDGMYARYFTHYTGKGRYSVKCQVIGDSDTQVNEGFINSKQDPEYLVNAGSPMCCGSNAVSPDSVLSNTGNFTRSGAGGAFQVQVDITGADFIPPSKVTTLTTLVLNSTTVRVRFTSPGDDLDSFEPPKKYVIKIGHHVNSTHFEESCCEVVEDDLFGSSTLNPVNGGSVKDIYIRKDYFDVDTKYMVAMIVEDEAHNKSPVSNVQEVFIASPYADLDTTTTTTTIPTTTTPKTTTSTTTTPKTTTSTTTTPTTTTPTTSFPTSTTAFAPSISISIIVLMVSIIVNKFM